MLYYSLESITYLEIVEEVFRNDSSVVPELKNANRFVPVNPDKFEYSRLNYTLDNAFFRLDAFQFRELYSYENSSIQESID